VLNGVKHLGSSPDLFAENEILQLRLQNDTDFVRCVRQRVAVAMKQSDWPDVSEEELAEARRYGMCIDWSPEEEVFIASFPDIPFVRTHGANCEEAAERGEELIVAWLTGLKDAGLPITPPKIRV
jgi:predicted RNase H-like HicB family nuclease